MTEAFALKANRPGGATVRNPPACVYVFAALASLGGHLASIISSSLGPAGLPVEQDTGRCH
jgi:hypothetical protein